MYVREKEKCRESEMQIIFENDTYILFTYAMMTTFFFQTLRFSSKSIHEFCIRFSLGKMSGEGYVCAVHYDKKRAQQKHFSTLENPFL